MDRGIVYTGQIPLDDDFLFPQRSAVLGLAKLSEAILGNGPVIDGLRVTATTPNSMAVLVEGGQIYVQAALDSSAYGTLPADTSHQVVKQGIMLDPLRIPLAAPATTGYQQYFLIQANFQERDEGAVALPYYNADNPTVSWSGPANSGEMQYRRRVGAIVIQAKAGIPAAPGGVALPAPDNGWTGLAYVLVTNGQVSIIGANITAYENSSRIPVKLPNLIRSSGLSVTTVTASTNLTAQQSGVVVVNMTALTGEITLRLPPANAAGGSPMRFSIVAHRPNVIAGNQYSARARILPSGSDSMVYGGVTLYAVDHAIMVSDGISRWHNLSRISQNSFSSGAGNNQTLPSGVATGVAVGVAAGNSPDNWLAPGETMALVCPYPSARVRVSAAAEISANTTGSRELWITVNGLTHGVVAAAPSPSGSTTIEVVGSGNIMMRGGDAVRVWARQNSGSSLSIVSAWADIEIVQ